MTGTEAPLTRLESLIDHGRHLRERLAVDPSSGDVLSGTRAWQRECAAMVNELSAGSKAHWLARAYGEAFLVRHTDGRAVNGAPIADIVTRILHVLDQAAASLARLQKDPAPAKASPSPHRFDFVHDAALRPILEAAYADSGQALAHRRFAAALTTFCGLLEAIVTDALVHAESKALATGRARAGPITEWPFDARIACAEQAGLIRGGCARLPDVARRYRELTDADGELRSDVLVSERDARVTGQVLRVVMRDLDPGR